MLTCYMIDLEVNRFFLKNFYIYNQLQNIWD